MKDINTQISPLIENLFPEFYKTDGESFIMFVKAYYEWLEQNHQLLDLEDSTNFNVGDSIAQADVTGVIVANVGAGILVRINGFDTFKCYNVCSELIPVTSSSGGNTYIKRGGTTRRLGTLFLSRNLLNMRDVDSTLDLFIVYFKEKYLKNIEFDVATNKQLLIKNALDLYRAKGTQRAIDLFFRLVYGVQTTVYNPGEDVLIPSSGEWTKPQYLEITPATENINLVGKQIVGVTSGASAFVEKYIKRKIKDGFVYILYLSNLSGTFANREILRPASGVVKAGLPTVVGSLTSVEIITGSSLFNVGDIVTFNSTRGDYGQARVSSISNDTGVVDFEFIEGGYGYTVSGNSSLSAAELEDRTQSIVSEKVVTLSNVVTSNTLSTITIVSGGSGYSNTDKIKVVSQYGNATGTIATDGSGVITAVNISNTGTGFYSLNPTVLVTNATGGSTTGSSANLVATTAAKTKYFEYYETLTEQLATIVYGNATNNQLITPGANIYISNGTANVAYGVVLSNANGALGDANGTLIISVQNNASFAAGNKLYVNGSVYCNIATLSNTSATGTVMGVPSKVTFTVGPVAGSTYAVNDVVYQLVDGVEVASATIEEAIVSLSGGSIKCSNLSGVFSIGGTLQARNKNTSATIQDITLDVGVYNVVNNYSYLYSAMGWSSRSGTTGNVVAVSSGSGASFKVGTISDAETIYINTDLLNSNNSPSAGANQAYMTLPINASAYGFPKSPLGNSASIIFSCLNFDNFTIGSIASLTAIDPGSDYNVDPYVLVQQPYISGFDYNDYIITVSDASGAFIDGERILQSNTTSNYYQLVVSDETGYTVGEKVYQGTSGSETATGIVTSITPSSNTITVNNVTGTFAQSTTLKSYINPALSATVTTVTLEQVTTTAKGIIKSSNTSTLYVKRLQFENRFAVGSQITGSQTGATATITSVVEDENALPIGLNANVQANVVTANGTVTSLQIIDSGVGYRDGEDMLYISADGLRSGTARAVVEGQGTGAGYYRTSKGFLSSTIKIHDGDYYQEYSYEILSRIPFEKYSEMLKKVLHVSGTRVFGGVLLEETLVTPAEVTNTAIEYLNSNTLQFNSNTNIVGGAITGDNDYANSVLIFKNGDKVKYTTSTGNTAVTLLANNGTYYVANANTTSIKLTTNPRLLSISFNANTSLVGSNFINIPRHMFSDNDYVKYTTSAGNTAISGLSNNSNYFVVSSNSSGIKLSTSRGGSAVAITPGLTQNGHNLTITSINIVANSTASGAATNGHFIAHINEI